MIVPQAAGVLTSPIHLDEAGGKLLWRGFTILLLSLCLGYPLRVIHHSFRRRFPFPNLTLTERSHHSPRPFKAGGDGVVVEVLEVILAIGARHIPDHGNGLGGGGEFEQARDGELMATALVDGHPVDGLFDVKEAGDLGSVGELARDPKIGFHVVYREVVGDGGRPGMHEVVDELQRHGFGVGKGRGFVEAVFPDLNGAG